jgi:hypothetical protein
VGWLLCLEALVVLGELVAVGLGSGSRIGSGWRLRRNPAWTLLLGLVGHARFRTAMQWECS